MRLSELLALVLACTGCGGSDVVLGDGRDAAAQHVPDSGHVERDAATGVDAATPDAPAFQEPHVISSLSNADTTDDDPSLTSDRLLLYFNSRRDGGLGREDVWQSARASAGDDWPEPHPVSELNSEARETGIALAADGLRIWWSSDRDGGLGGLDVYGASRASRADPWSDVQPVAALNSAGDELVSALSSDGRSLLLARRDDEDDDYDLYVAARDGLGAFSAPEPIAELNSDDEESDGFLPGDGSTLIFTRDEDLMLALRPSANEPFGPAAPLTTLNSPDDDRDPWASDDLDYVIFSSDRSGSYLLYEAVK